MAYVTTNPRTLKDLQEKVASGEKLRVFQPGPFGRDLAPTGAFDVEGPHFPEPHEWYAEVFTRNGIIVNVAKRKRDPRHDT